MKSAEESEFHRVGIKSVNNVTHRVQSLLQTTVRLKVKQDDISLVVRVLEPREPLLFHVVFQRDYNDHNRKHGCLDHGYLLVQGKRAETYR